MESVDTSYEGGGSETLDILSLKGLVAIVEEQKETE
jgi:hypothetical protein